MARHARQKGMTAPREVLPGRTYLVTRRCTQRQYLLTPSTLTNQLICYCLAVAANQTGILLHAYCFMSNHWHGVLTDPEARLPEFLEQFHRLLARAMNVALGRRENFWSSEKPSAVWLVADSDIAEAVAYTIANPTAAGLVASPEEWPGVLTRQLGESVLVDMPDVFFDRRGTLPQRVELRSHHIPARTTRPGGGAPGGRFRAALQRLVNSAHEVMRSQGLRFVGAAAILRQSVSSTPSSIERNRASVPVVSAESRELRRAAFEHLRWFVLEYRRAWSAWRGGMRDTVFPAGTYALRRFARVNCAPPLAFSA